MAALPFLLAACSSDRVVTEPLTLPPVADELMKTPVLPRCDLVARASYPPGEIKAYAECWRTAYYAIAARHAGLQSAIAVRQRAAAKAIAAAKSNG